jgi:hypothetical protein
MLQLSNKIKEACLNKQIDKLTQIFSLVKPYSYTDTQNSLLKFDLFSLEASAIEKLEYFLNATTTTTTTTTNESTKKQQQSAKTSATTQNSTSSKINYSKPTSNTADSSKISIATNAK